MSPRTPTLPLDEPTMWRKLLARTHPDAGGTHELFIWAGAVKKAVCGGELRVEPKPRPAPQHTSSPDDKPRIPFPIGADFEEVTHAALRMGASLSEPYGAVLSLLSDCWPLSHLAYEQERGASYKRLAAIAHTWGMSKEERVGWYRVAEEIPLSDRHARHILSKLKRQAA
jgi:hypothetical protein